ncbi:helix-turn-helix transcriptional regulator [Millisia brevis]|uniref:helix-turn-helix transcriptional regulator n=1 Tax=Millisia brevis TaxID=264148 RepID=UPI00082CDE17|nr:helix-turn-helix transcriptional regulator [Millisia brevis]
MTADDPDASAGARAAGELRRRELASFLRSRRERISPAEVGLPQAGRRRTPGLRREEVAQLAGVGVTWYTWLEQGRAIRVSVQVLDAVARTLHLDPSEREHLYTLTDAGQPEQRHLCAAVPDRVRAVVSALPYPANIANPRRDILFSNDLSARIWGPYDEEDPDGRNVLVQIFVTKRWRSVSIDWKDSATTQVSEFRSAMATHMAEPAWTRLLDRLLTESPEFAEIWARHEVGSGQSRTKLVRSRDVGLLKLDYTHFWLGPTSDLRMTTYTPADSTTESRLATLREVIAARAA